jgi:hypothetical protein
MLSDLILGALSLVTMICACVVAAQAVKIRRILNDTVGRGGEAADAAADKWRCGACGNENQPGDLHCVQCGRWILAPKPAHPISWLCSACGKWVHWSIRECPYCEEGKRPEPAAGAGHPRDVHQEQGGERS